VAKRSRGGQGVADTGQYRAGAAWPGPLLGETRRVYGSATSGRLPNFAPGCGNGEGGGTKVKEACCRKIGCDCTEVVSRAEGWVYVSHRAAGVSERLRGARSTTPDLPGGGNQRWAGGDKWRRRGHYGQPGQQDLGYGVVTGEDGMRTNRATV